MLDDLQNKTVPPERQTTVRVWLPDGTPVTARNAMMAAVLDFANAMNTSAGGGELDVDTISVDRSVGELTTVRLVGDVQSSLLVMPKPGLE